MKDLYRTNIKVYRDTSFARQAITTCGEFKSRTTNNTPYGSTCSHNDQNEKESVLDRFVTSINERPAQETYTNALRYRRNREDFPGFEQTPTIRKKDSEPVTPGLAAFQGMST